MRTLREARPDVLLLDLDMPEVTGFDLLKDIRRDRSLRHLPVIVLTGLTDAATQLRVLQAGANDFLAKPVDPVDPIELALRMRNTLFARAAQMRLTHLDSLTDLPNRPFFMQLLSDRLSHGRDLTTSAEPAVLILLNTNRYKAINDSLGADHVDEVLRRFSNRLVAALCTRARLSADKLFDSRRLADRSLSCVARLGGDRFAVLLPLDSDVPDRNVLTHHLQHFVELMERPIIVNGKTSYLSASTGVAAVASDSDSVESIVNDAETAMRHAKLSATSGYAFHSAHMDTRARELLSLENGLRNAVERGEVFLLYQPKVDVRTGRITGAEALVRWNNPVFGLISPANFIPIAEDNGMIFSIGAWVLSESCRQMRLWRDLGHDDCRIAANVSIRRLEEPDFIDTVGRALDESGLEPSALIIELTENMVMENAESNLIKLGELNALGVQLAIDDFGTGYSSLAYFQRFPLDQLKIDRSFVATIEVPTSHAPIIKAVTSLAHDLGLSVVAEGVETIHQLDRVRDCGCEEYQGYLCSRPMPAKAFFGRLEQGAVLPC